MGYIRLRLQGAPRLHLVGLLLLSGSQRYVRYRCLTALLPRSVHSDLLGYRFVLSTQSRTVPQSPIVRSDTGWYRGCVRVERETDMTL